MDIGRRLNLLVKQSDARTYRGFARKAKLSRPSLMAIIEDRSSPTLDTLEKILKAAGSSFSEFFKSPVVRSYHDPEHQELHEMLQELLVSGGNGAIMARETIRAAYDRHVRHIGRSAVTA